MRPDYHATFAYADALNARGWKVGVMIDAAVDSRLVFRNTGTWVDNSRIGFFSVFKGFLNLVVKVAGHENIVYYGRPPMIYPRIQQGLQRWLGEDFWLELSILRVFGRKVIYLPTGCHEILPRAKFSLLDGGNVCGNCGFSDRCDDVINEDNFRRIRKYFNFSFSDGSIESSEYPSEVFPWKSIDLELWSPNLEVPADFRLPDSSAIRIMHSNFLEKSGRDWMGKNIKGTPYVVAAVERLKSEGHNVEYIFADNLHIADVRFVQAQADIVVEQLIYGWWGSTGVEAMALGKPVVCYLRKEWKENFFRNFPKHDSLPIVEANTATIYDVLKGLVLDDELRNTKGRESREFAEAHFSPEINSRKLESLLLTGEY